MSAPADPHPHIEARGLSGRRSSRTVFSDVRVSLSAGEILVVTGPNGSGKSTLLETLALLRESSHGELRLFGAPARVEDPALRRRVTLAMQPGLLLRRSVLKNILLGLEARGLSRDAALERARVALASVGAAALERRQIRGLSAGERQRVNLARALALPVDLLLFDEPLTGLDGQGLAQVLALLEGVRAAGQQSIVIATPEDQRLLDCADHVLALPGPPA